MLRRFLIQKKHFRNSIISSALGEAPANPKEPALSDFKDSGKRPFIGNGNSARKTFGSKPTLKRQTFQSRRATISANQEAISINTSDPSKKELVFIGKHEGRRLTVKRLDKTSKLEQQIVFTFLHANRYLFRYETKDPDRTRFKRQYQIGATKKGEPFAGKGDSSPECVVSGGKGTMAVTYKGKTWYVCCSGCRAEFNENPEKYIKEFEAKKKKP